MKPDLYIYCTQEDTARWPCPDGVESMSFEEFARVSKDRSLIRKQGKYHDVFLYTPNFDSIVHPFFVAVICRYLASRHCVYINAQGEKHHIGAARIMKEAGRFLYENAIYRVALRGVEREIKTLEATPAHHGTMNKKASPVYLRCDYTYGFLAGGSVGHIAGVVNHLTDCFDGQPLFFTTCEVPTVRQDIPKVLLDGKTSYRYVRGITGLFFNRTVYEKTSACLADRNISILYQRSALDMYVGVQLALDRELPYVLEYNGSEVWISRKWGGHRPKAAKLSERIEMLTFEKADLIVCVSQPLKDELIERGITPEKILVNPNAVDTERYRPDIDGAPVRERYGIAPNEIVVGFIGTFGAWHGAEVLAQAFADLLKTGKGLPPLRLLMIGDGARMEAVRGIIEHEQIACRCILTGIVPQEKGPEYLAACDILASPQVPNADGSPFFGSPTKLFEYMAMGKAIVASDLDQLGEIIEHEKTGLLCKPGDTVSLTDALKRLARDEELRHVLGANARREAEEKHTWSAHVARTMDALTALPEKKENVR